MQALYPVAILLNKPYVYFSAAEKFDVGIPSPGNICRRRV
jgi:hypothetical protein